MQDELENVAQLFRNETGLSPDRFKAAVKAGAGPQGRANALLGDLDFYRRHTEEIKQRLRRALNASIP